MAANDISPKEIFVKAVGGISDTCERILLDRRAPHRWGFMPASKKHDYPVEGIDLAANDIDPRRRFVKAVSGMSSAVTQILLDKVSKANGA